MENIVAVREPMKLWDIFAEHFFDHIMNSMTKEERGRFWHVSKDKRTKGYREILAQVANKMDLMYDAEHLSVDHALLKSVDGVKYNLPIVLVESENDFLKSDHEVAKLLSMCVPLRVLITWAQWSEEQFQNKQYSHDCCRRWKQVIEPFAGQLRSYGMPLGGVLGFLVGECDREDNLRYYYFCCDLRKLQLDTIFSDWPSKEVGKASL